MTRRTIHVAALVLASSLAMTGCSSSSGEDGGSIFGPKDPKAAAMEVARTYMDAAKREDWKTACPLESQGFLHGTVEQCVATNTEDETPAPKASSGPARADVGPSKASDVVDIPAVGRHPAGYGVLVTYTYTWPGKPTETSRVALRLVEEGGSWRVDQRKDVRPKDMAHMPDMPALVRAVLTAGGQ
ncbi:hypothetical protein [Streptomyces sp. NBC_01408]|uniref:hypothetical protein n=1 Tax=Streptomyces sp. NBC_01408 TaxID=2903855 RepID=UPI00225271B9|nr:hypothetical protein [Streptomyces sp. NBC_01408]MCX4690945.1 hypothetical protein [Streptomyces sp. NBC_01408]